MRKIKFLFFLLFISSSIFSQSMNDYVAIIIPVKYGFVKQENEYRLNTLTKVNLKKAGFEAFYSNETIPKEYNDRCSLLYVDVMKEGAFLLTKLFITFKDCNGKTVFNSKMGKSKEKDYGVAYIEALNEAFESVYALHYKYNGGVNTNSQKTGIMAPVVTTAVIVNTNTGNLANTPNLTEGLLLAQPIKNGFQLMDNTSKALMKIYTTTNPAIYLAMKENIQGVMILKDSDWFFEYYQNEILMSEKITVKF